MWSKARILYPLPPMSKNQTIEADDDVELVPMLLPLDRETIAWLARLQRATGDHPNAMVASMLRDIRADDESEHAQAKLHS